MAMKGTRQIEEICRGANLDPRITSILCDMAERLKVQHQQDMELALAYSKLVDLIQELANKVSALGGNLERSGLMDKLKQIHNLKGDLSNVSEQDDDTQSTHEYTRNPRGDS